MLEKGFTSTIARLARGARFVMVFVFVFFLPAFHPAFAQSEAAKSVEATAQAAGVAGGVDLLTIVGRIIYVALGFVGILLLAYLLYAGFLWMTSGGETENVKKAKLMIRNAVIGLLIITAAFGITRFILGLLSGVSEGDGIGGGGGTGAGGFGFPGAAGSLGRGIIESHIPSRDATGVARNTSIIITFKEPIKIASVIQDYNDNGTPADLSDDANSSTAIGLNATVFKIFPTGASDKALATSDARVRFTADRRTFVIKPAGLLGSPTANMGYTVSIAGGSGGLKRADGKPAFTGAFSSGYLWQFEVSTVVDLTPPRLLSAIPFAGGVYPPNVVVQMHFSKPLDPTSASGVLAAGAGFTNIQIKAGAAANPGKLVNGEYRISNNYTTVEFVTDLPCGVNSCGKKIYCLPASQSLLVLVEAPTMSKDPPQAELTQAGYDGIVDTVGNGFDGNSNGKAEGPEVDGYDWTFGTSDKPNLDPPIIKSTDPPAGDLAASGNLPVDHIPSATFDSVIQSSTITTDSVFLKTSEPAQMADTFWYTPFETLVDPQGNEATSSSPIVGGKISINHRVYAPAPKVGQAYEYDPVILSDVQNIYQNCFNPSVSKTGACMNGPSCCNNKDSATACAFPPAK